MLTIARRLVFIAGGVRNQSLGLRVAKSLLKAENECCAKLMVFAATSTN